MEFRYLRTVWGYECDAYGHLNNANYLHIFEEARAQALIELGIPVSELLRRNVHIYVTGVDLRFRKGVPVEARVEVVSRVMKLNRLTAEWEQEIHDESGALYASATIYAVFARNGKPFRVDEELMALFQGEKDSP
jgi:YbgC/YbaW family acyl-CoA thioester hydrolase